MAKSPSRTPLIAAVILVLVVLAGFNALNEKYRPKSEKDLEAEAHQAQAEAAKGKPGATPTPAPAQPTGDPATASALVGLGPDAVLGTKGAKTTVTVGWSWTPEVQSDPNKVWAGIKAVQQAAPTAQIHVVNTDENASVPDGVSIGGNVMVPLGADGSLASSPGAYQAVQAAAASGSEPVKK